MQVPGLSNSHLQIRAVLADSEINIQEIARRLGHSDVQMTWNAYSRLYPKEERAIEILNKIV